MTRATSSWKAGLVLAMSTSGSGCITETVWHFIKVNTAPELVSLLSFRPDEKRLTPMAAPQQIGISLITAQIEREEKVP